MPQVHGLLISNTTVRVNSIARTLEHARRSQLPLREVLKLHELAYSGKNKDKMVELATQNYESNTDKAPSQHHPGDGEDSPRAKFKNHGTIDKKDFPPTS